MSESAEIYAELLKRRESISRELAGIDSRLRDLGAEKRSIVVKKIHGEPYYYEQWRNDKRIESRFIGKAAPGVIAETETVIQERNALLHSRKEKAEALEMLDRSIRIFQGGIKKEPVLKDYSFEVFWKDELSARVKVIGSAVKVNRLLKHPAKSIFAADRMTRPQLNEILALRCFERGRADISAKLRSIGLTEYNPYEIVKRTHGVSYNDYIWIRFPGEKLRSEDVLVRE